MCPASALQLFIFDRDDLGPSASKQQATSFFLSFSGVASADWSAAVHGALDANRKVEDTCSYTCNRGNITCGSNGVFEDDTLETIPLANMDPIYFCNDHAGMVAAVQNLHTGVSPSAAYNTLGN